MAWVSALGVLAAPAAAETAVFTAGADTSIARRHAGLPNGSRHLRIDGSPVVRALVRFDVALPAGATVTAARLSLFAATRRSRSGYRVAALTGRGANAWSESVRLRRAPRSGRRVGRRGGWNARGYKTAALVRGAVPARGPVSFSVETGSRAAKVFLAREGRHPPRLMISYAASPAAAAEPLRTRPAKAPPESRPRRFSDEFVGPAGAAPDPAVWAMKTGGRWMNGGTPELQCYTKRPENVSLDGLGHLRITARYEPGSTYCGDSANDYTSARLDTRGLKSFHYGRIEARIRLPTAAGSWAAWWMVGATGSWPSAGEIDILEYRHGAAPGAAHHAIHADTTGGAHWHHNTDTLDNWTDGWHTYGIDWTRNRIDFQIDGITRWTRTPATMPTGANWPFNQPFGLLLNVAIGNWGGTPDPAQYPTEMLIDWVRAAPAAISGTCHSPCR